VTIIWTYQADAAEKLTLLAPGVKTRSSWYGAQVTLQPRKLGDEWPETAKFPHSLTIF
jgi:hypothetical protein